MRMLLLAAAVRRAHGITNGNILNRLADSLGGRRYAHCSVGVDGKLFVLGGFYTGNIPTNESHVYDVASDIWSSVIAPAPVAVWNATAVVIDGFIYYYGGIDNSSGRPKYVYKYNIATNVWSVLSGSNTIEGRSGHSAVVIGGKIYVYGGISNVWENRLYVFDPATGSWTAKANGPQAMQNHSAVVIDGKMYIFGGRNNSGVVIPTVYMYDPVSNLWSQKTSSPTPRHEHAATVIDGKMLVVGGRSSNSGGNNATIEEYDPSSDTWTIRLTDDALLGTYPSASEIAGKMYIFGGFSNLLYEYIP